MKSKILPYPTWPNVLALVWTIVQALRVRLVSVSFCALAIALSGSASASPASDPAFIGITMGDMQNGECRIGEVEPGSAAEAAHVLWGDVIVAFDGQLVKATAAAKACETLTTAITSHRAGDVVQLQVARNGELVNLAITLSSRSELLKHRLLDQAMSAVEVVDADDPGRTITLDVARVSIVGWYYPSVCSNCAVVFEHVADRAAKVLHHAVPVIAAGHATREQLDRMSVDADLSRDRIGTKLVAALGIDRGTPPGVRSVAVVPASDGQFPDRLTFADNRIYFTVIDAHGVVRLVAPASPEADDVDTVLDEVVAAAEHCDRAPAGRR